MNSNENKLLDLSGTMVQKGINVFPS